MWWCVYNFIVRCGVSESCVVRLELDGEARGFWSHVNKRAVGLRGDHHIVGLTGSRTPECSISLFGLSNVCPRAHNKH